MRNSIALYGTKYASTCPKCIVQGYVEAQQCCACYVTRPRWQTRALKAFERTFFNSLWKKGWFSASTAPHARRSAIGRQSAMSGALATVAEEGEAPPARL